MGMYTEIFFRSRLKKDVPEEILQLLTRLVEGDVPDDFVGPAHEFFQTARWTVIGVMGSAYFPRMPESSLTDPPMVSHGERGHLLVIHSNLKNYDDEISKFFSWIDPYCDEDQGSLLGYSQYEDSERTPTLYYQSGP